MKKTFITRVRPRGPHKRRLSVLMVQLLFGLAVFIPSVILANPHAEANAVADSIPPSAPIAEIDAPVYNFMAENNVPGISLAITRNEEIVYVRSYGFADRETKTRLTPDHLFRIASISKPITSIAILKLVEEKKLSLDDKVIGPKGILGTKYGKKPYRKWVTDITIRHLLQHLGGGWGNSRNDPMFRDPSVPMDQLINSTIDTLQLTHQPGTQYAYSNFGYCLLGKVIEKLSGQPYDSYVKSTILLPSGVSDMVIGGNSFADRKENEVKYYGQHNEDPYCCNITRMDAHGGWIATASDLVKILVHSDGNTAVKDLLSPETVRVMRTPPVPISRYALGWFIDSLGNWSHSGSLPGTRTELRGTPDGYGYAILLNTRSYDSAFNNGLRRLINAISQVKIALQPTKETTANTSYRPPALTTSEKNSGMERTYAVTDSICQAFMQKNNVPGFAYGIVRNGKLDHKAGFGYSDLSKKIPATPSSVFRIASMTKSFAAMAILMLRDAGKLRLEDPVAKYIPELGNTPPLTSDSPPITILNLLSHTAGFPEDNPWADRQLQRTDSELVAFIGKGISLSSVPGDAYEYSNLGFAMLGRIITIASGMHYEQYIRKNIFQALGMHHTYWEYTEVPSDLLVHGYRWVNGNWREEEMLHSGAYGVMGGMLTSIEDFSKYLSMHISAWPARTGQEEGILTRNSIRQMHIPGNISGFFPTANDPAGNPCPRVSSYNFGLVWTRDCTGKEGVGHSGGLPGFGTQWTFLPEYGIGIVSFSSRTYAPNTALNNLLLDTIIRMTGLQPRKLPPSEILEQRKTQLIKLLPDWKNAAESGIFSENFFADYFIDSLRKDCRALFAKAGRIIRVGEMEPDNQLRGNFRIEGEHTDIFVRFTLSPEDPALIQYFSIKEAPKQTTPAKGKYGLAPMASITDYEALVSKEPKQQLVALEKFIPGIQLDIRYATSNNIMKRPVYNIPAAYMRLPAAEALKAVQEELRPLGYGLKIYDAYRPYDVTVIFYEQFHDTTFVASPYSGSRHNRGCAVDLTMIDLKTGKEVEMPTPYDDFTKTAHAVYPDVSRDALHNRSLLQRLMLKNGFVIYPDEWWHFDFGGWDKFPLMNIPFESLKKR